MFVINGCCLDTPRNAFHLCLISFRNNYKTASYQAMANLQKSNCLHRYTEVALLRAFLEKISLFSVVYNKFQLKHQMRKGLGTYLTITRWTKFNCSTERLIEKSKAPIIHAYNCAKSAYIIRIILVRRYCQVCGVLRWDTSLAKSMKTYALVYLLWMVCSSMGIVSIGRLNRRA